MSNQLASAHTSLSSSSIITVQRGPGQNSEAIHIRSASPAEGAILAAKALKASTAPRGSARGSDLNDPAEEHNITPNRASRPPRPPSDDRPRQRLNDSPSGSPKPNRPQSGPDSPSRWKQPTASSRLGDYLPGKTDPKRNSAASSPSSRRSRPSFGPDGLQKLRNSDNKSYVPSLLSPSAARPSTPGTSTTTGTKDSDDYFGLGIAVSKDGARSPGPVNESTRRRRENLPESPTTQKHPQRNSTRRDKDKKTMLSKALEKANTAVLLDNAQNFDGALDAYMDACKLLEQVMERTAGSEDRGKLEAIRNTYAARVEELAALKQPSAPTALTEKELPPLPPRPDSESHAPQLPQLDTLAPMDTSIAELPAELPAGPSTSTAGRIRDSFLTDAIREVEGSRASGFLGPLWERSKTPLSSGVESARSREDLMGADAPQPLSTRSRSPNPASDTTSSHQIIDDGESGSWLNTIDESDSDDAASLHSIRKNAGIRRRNISGDEPRKVSDFDSAFDAAVEAAYEDGYEPDQGDDEQQMMDDIARDYMDQAYTFSERSKSSLPRASGSTAGTRDTWKSSIVGPDRGTGGTSLSTLDEDYGSVLPRLHFDQSSSATSQADTVGLATTSVGAAAPPEQPLRQRRSNLSNGGVKPLTIDTAAKRDIKKRQSVASPITASSQRNVEVTPWEATDNKAEVTPWEVQPLQKAEVTPWEVQSPPTPTSAGSRVGVSLEQALRERRSTRSLSTVSKPLTIDTRAQRKRAPSNASRVTQSSQRDLEVAPWEAVEQKSEVTPWEVQPVQAAEVTPWEVQAGPSDSRPLRMGSLRKDGHSASTAMSGSGSPMLADMTSPKSKTVKTQSSSMSLREHVIEVPTPTQAELPTPTPTSATFSSTFAKRNNSTSQLSQRSVTLGPASTPVPPLPEQLQQQGGYYLFDTTLGRSVDNQPSSSPKATRESLQPTSFEPCPDSPLLRPFWLMRLVANSVTHPRGAYITTKLFMPREAWMNKSIKLKNVEDKIAACDLLSAALASMAQVNTYDADAVLHELQKLEEVMERVQQTLIKKLGNEVGVSNATSLFKEADKTSMDGSQDGSARDSKSKFSWRKIRGKSVLPGSSGLSGSIKGSIPESANMQTVPMTSFTGVEKRTVHRREALSNAVFEGPLKDYMAALAKVCESAQAIDQVARQVEDPGLKASSTTLVGLEFSTRHAAEFFGFYLCRFMLSDIGTLIDKHVKRGTEWVLS